MQRIELHSSPLARWLISWGLLVCLSGCAIVGDIFKAGVWVAVIGMGLLGLAVFGISSLFRGRS